MLPISISYFVHVLVYFVLFRTAFIIIVILSNVLFNLYYWLCTFIVVYYFWHHYSIIHLYCANFVIGLRAVKLLHTNKFELNWIIWIVRNLDLRFAQRRI
jgi:hypothetical protein